MCKVSLLVKSFLCCRDPVTRGQDKVFLRLIPHAKEKVGFEIVL